MAKTGGTVKRLTEKAKRYHLLRAHGGFRGQYGTKGETRELIARREESMRDRRAGGARYMPPAEDHTIPTYDPARVQRCEPGRFIAFRFGQENRRAVTCYGNGERRWSRGGLLNCWHMSEHETELLGPDKLPKR